MPVEGSDQRSWRKTGRDKVETIVLAPSQMTRALTASSETVIFLHKGAIECYYGLRFENRIFTREDSIISVPELTPYYLINRADDASSILLLATLDEKGQSVEKMAKSMKLFAKTNIF